jgi:drug/metabolite transporter (DMT)-like permease
MTPHDREQRLGTVLVAGAAVSWSTAGYFAALIHLSLFEVLVWRNLFGGLFMLGFLAIAERGGVVRSIAGLGWTGWFVAGVNGVSMLCYLGALRHTSVANTVVIYATAPFAAAALAWLVMRERTSRRTLATGALALVGVAITVLGTGGSTGLLGDLLAGGMTLGVAVFTVVARRHRERSMLAASAMSAWIGGALALPFVSTLDASGAQLGQLAAFGVTSFGLGLALYTLGSRHLPAARSALISTLDTPLAPLWVWLAFGDGPAVATVIGGVIVLSAVVVNIAGERPAAARAPMEPAVGPTT